ncbi:tetratricopeptide (TPR) repeat protein [Lelliottia sp. 489]|uniref:TIR domain-containing protein n=1 Tax=Lelliottia sp. 489 TaxID=3156448 RepID=UPI003D21CEAA
MKAFLSHNFSDKNFVKSIYDNLTATHAVFDEKTFPSNSYLIDEIRNSMLDCDIFVLFLSKQALESKWVNGEIDLAKELAFVKSIKKIMVFLLDDTKWSELPPAFQQYRAESVPNPIQIGITIKNELHALYNNKVSECYGREDDVKKITSHLVMLDSKPKFIFLSGPDGIGRRTLAREVYRKLFRLVSGVIELSIDEFANLDSVHSSLIKYTSNWRAREFLEEKEKFSKLNEIDKIRSIGVMIDEICIPSKQALFIDVSSISLNNDGELSSLLKSLINSLNKHSWPHVVFISKRHVDIDDMDGGYAYQVYPLTEGDSIYLFRMLINQYGVDIPKQEMSIIEQSVIGHPGLINMVATYLKTNPNYKLNKTHGTIVSKVRIEVSRLIQDFINNDKEIEKVIGLFGMTEIISFSEAQEIGNNWAEFENGLSRLIDSGFVQYRKNDYRLSSYLQNEAQKYSNVHRNELLPKVTLLLKKYSELDSETYVPIDILDARIVSHLTTNEPLPDYLQNFLMPMQLIRASKRRYNERDYVDSLKLAKEAYEWRGKLSVEGIIETWRLIGLSSARTGSEEQFAFFEEQYGKIPNNYKKDIIYNFVNAFKFRLNGKLKDALNYLMKIEKKKDIDAHVFREIATIYSFDERFEEAIDYADKALSIDVDNPFILDIKVWALLSLYRKERVSPLVNKIEECLDKLKVADERKNTTFFHVREKMKDVLVDEQSVNLLDSLSRSSKLNSQLKISLLEIFSAKGRDYQYAELLKDLQIVIGQKKDHKIIEVNLAKVKIKHAIGQLDFPEAEALLNRWGRRFTDYLENNLRVEIQKAKAYSKY